MAKSRLKRLILLISLIPIFSGCGYKFIAATGKKIFLRPIVNSTLQPNIDIYLNKELRQTLIEYPEFSPVNQEKAAEYLMHIEIKKWERLPLFFSKEGGDEITIAKFQIEVEVAVSKKGGKFTPVTIKDTLSVPLAREYKEEDILQKTSKKLSDKIYIYLLEKNEKEKF
jgi:hypothetical protein